MEGATAIAHGCAGAATTGASRVSARALARDHRDRACARVGYDARARRSNTRKARNIPVPSDRSPYSIDANLWGRSIARGVLEDPCKEPPDDIYLLTRSPQHGPDEPAYIEIEFDQGVPVRANGIEMPLVELIESLETIAGAHGVGRIDMVENRLVGPKSREVYEAPSAVLLHTAHRELEMLVVPRDLERLVSPSGPRVRRSRLQRPLVLADARSHRRLRREGPTARHGIDSTEAVQGQTVASSAAALRSPSAIRVRRRSKQTFSRSSRRRDADDGAPVVRPVRRRSRRAARGVRRVVSLRSPPVRGRRARQPGVGRGAGPRRRDLADGCRCDRERSPCRARERHSRGVRRRGCSCLCRAGADRAHRRRGPAAAHGSFEERAGRRRSPAVPQTLPPGRAARSRGGGRGAAEPGGARGRRIDAVVHTSSEGAARAGRAFPAGAHLGASTRS